MNSLEMVTIRRCFIKVGSIAERDDSHYDRYNQNHNAIQCKVNTNGKLLVERVYLDAPLYAGFKANHVHCVHIQAHGREHGSSMLPCKVVYVEPPMEDCYSTHAPQVKNDTSGILQWNEFNIPKSYHKDSTHICNKLSSEINKWWR